MTQVLDIPIIARGRVIMPGDDGVHYKGRGGADFRQADPHKHIHDLVLGDTSRMRDLHDTPMAEIIDLLAELGKRLRLDDNPLLQESFALALKAGGLAEPILRGVYDALPHMFDPVMMTALVDKTIGLAYLDGWVSSGGAYESVSIRAVGTRQLHITAGNVPVVAAMTIARAAPHQVRHSYQVAIQRSADRQCDRSDADRDRFGPPNDEARRGRLLEGWR
ncbi:MULTISPECIES: acyl-CoA reductase [unclassified Novosphingobium]|uniref:acyl-CoA reductase n=1 Tax=unclassified Novosphingobium TaxID=2644732 RepID=UPI00135B7C03|nr:MULTISPECIES: acyl-CoA reductase [unclassified Novosphingobium]